MFGRSATPARAIALALQLLFLVSLPGLAAAQTPAKRIDVHGELSVTGLIMPNQPEGDGTREFRSRARVELTADPSPWLRLKFDGTVDGLLADRQGRVEDVVARAREAWVEARGSRVDLRVGYGRLVWGRLDEIMPSDVINPIDTSRYFLEGRAEARLPVAFTRGRLFLSDATTIEAIVSLPGRRGRFDELDEPTSPFNLTRDLVVIAAAPGEIRRVEPEHSWDNVQVGGRASTTLGRVDASVSAYRGFESFGSISLEPAIGAGTLVVGELVERYSQFTMVATDAEAVVGPWSIRGEVAYFLDRKVAGAFGAVDGRALDAGVGVDRAAGDYRLFTSVVWHRDWTTEGPELVNHDLSIIGSIERRFSRDRYLVRVFGVGNPVDESGFLRGLAAWSVRDNVALEASAGLLFGTASSADTLSRFRDRDFAFVRVRWFF
jgi:hypothetical protein